MQKKREDRGEYLAQSLALGNCPLVNYHHCRRLQSVVGSCESNVKSAFSTTLHCLLRVRFKIVCSQENDYFLTNVPLAVVWSGRKEFCRLLLFLIFTIFLIKEGSI